jgi:hypothetical protein
MSITALEEAKEALADREGRKGSNKTEKIGYWSPKGQSGTSAEVIGEWASNVVGIDAVIWTDLDATFDHPNLDDKVIAHLRSLPYEKGQNAERYIRRAPRQIDTEVRRRIEKELGWSAMDYSQRVSSRCL